MESHSNVSEFILWGISYDQDIQMFCFVFFLFCYVSILLGKFLILVSIQCSSLFHHPMCNFLSHLSCVDICYNSSVTPKLISDLLLGTKTISHSNCILQVFTMHFFGSTEIFILRAMAFDRYIAICKPLYYMIIMDRSRRNLLVLAAWMGGPVRAIPQLSKTIQLPFCVPNVIDHYSRDIFPLLKVACTDTYITGALVVANSGIASLVTFVVLFVSYVIIFFTLRNHSTEGIRKALCTCGSHITVVVLFFGPSIFIYLRPPNTYPEDKIFTLFYTIIAPMFNTLIYTLKNTHMKNAMRNDWCHMLL